MSQWNVDELLDDGHLPSAAAHVLVANHVLPFNLLQSADTTVDIVAEGGDQTGGLGKAIPLQTSPRWG